jgi:hAT family C-terminal dimerisation region
LKHAIQLLQPFNDFIHQIEADRPALGRVFEGLMQLDAHVKAAVKKWDGMQALEPSLGEVEPADSALRTWERRLDNTHGKAVRKLLHPAHIAAFLLDPLYANTKSENDISPPMLSGDREKEARELVKRVGGPSAAREFDMFMLEGYTGAMGTGARACIPKEVIVGTKRDREQVASVKARKGVWKRYGAERFPALAQVALRLLSVHPTSASTERNWSLWGRVFVASRNALGLERAKKLIMFCFNSRAQDASMQDLALCLDVVENEVDTDEQVNL